MKIMSSRFIAKTKASINTKEPSKNFARQKEHFGCLILLEPLDSVRTECGRLLLTG